MILVLSDLWLPFPGGAERLMFNLARHLQRRGEIVVTMTGYHEAQRFDGPPVVQRSIDAEADMKRFLSTLGSASWSGAGVKLILTHHYWAFEYEDAICAAGVPVVQVVLNGRRLRCASLAVYISEYVRSQPDKTPQPGDLTITPPAFSDVVSAEHGDAIGFIKPLPHKGVELVYEIARRMPDRRFVILRGEWQHIEIIERLPNVEFLEPVDDIRDFYRECRLILMPSISEDAGTVAQEAALNGLPCISSDVGGLPETNRGGILLDTRDPRGWVEMIRRLAHREAYNEIVARQHAAMNLVDQQAALDTFADRVHDLAR